MIAAALLGLLVVATPPPSLTPEQAAALVERLGLEPGTRITIRELGSQTDSGQSTGAGGSASGDTADLDVNSSAPGLTLGDASGTGGDARTKLGGTGWSPPNNATRWTVLGLGLLLLLAAGGCVYMGLRRAGTILGVAGVALFAGALYPAIFLWLALGALVVLAAPYLIAEFKAKREGSSLAAVIKGVNALKVKDPEAYAKVKSEVEKKADKADTVTISRKKRALGLGG